VARLDGCPVRCLASRGGAGLFVERPVAADSWRPDLAFGRVIYAHQTALGGSQQSVSGGDLNGNLNEDWLLERRISSREEWPLVAPSWSCADGRAGKLS